jgi:integrase
VRREKTVLSDEQIDNLLDYLFEKDKQQACWLALAICSGARFSELLRFKTDLIDENRTAFGDVFLETTRKIKTKGRGKSGKLLYKYIFKEKFLPYYVAWLNERKNILGKIEKDHNYIFIKDNGKPITGTTVRAWLEEFEDYLGVPIYAHAFRHYLATMLSKKNVPQNVIKEIFGWSSLEMVSVYDDSSAKDREYDELKNLKL